MTREKAYEILDKVPLCSGCDGSTFPYNCVECEEAFLTAFAALKQPEIVLCKDCLYKDNTGISSQWLPCMDNKFPDDFFCARGKRNGGDGE